MTRIFLSTFALIFLAELGDKTQIATFALAGRTAQGSARWVVFAASALALTCASAIAVLAGSAIARAVPQHLVRWIAGILFVAAGLWILLRG